MLKGREAIGLGAMGFHAYLQKTIFHLKVSMQVVLIGDVSYIKTSQTKLQKLAIERGACPDDDTASVRNAHLLAIAPNAVLVYLW